MHILFFTECYWPVSNGVVVSLETLKEALEQDGHRVTVVTPRFPGRVKRKDVVELPSLPLLVNPDYRVCFPVFSQLEQSFAKNSFDLVHCHHPFIMGRLGLKLARMYGKSVIFTHHTYYSLYLHYVPLPRRLIRGVLEKLVLSFCNSVDMVICPGDDIKKDLQSLQVATPLVVMPTWVEPGGEKIRGQKLLLQFGVPPEKKKCIYAGRCVPEKNVSFLLRMFTHLPEDQYHLLIVGEGVSRKDLQLEAEALQLKNVSFTGLLDRHDVLSLFKGCDLFVFASETETQGIVILEALSCGLPVVALDASGVRDIIRSGEQGFLCSKDERLMAEKVKAVFEAKRYERMRKMALQTAKKYRKDRLYIQLVKWYEILTREGTKEQSST